MTSPREAVGVWDHAGGRPTVDIRPTVATANWSLRKATTIAGAARMVRYFIVPQ